MPIALDQPPCDRTRRLWRRLELPRARFAGEFDLRLPTRQMRVAPHADDDRVSGGSVDLLRVDRRIHHVSPAAPRRRMYHFASNRGLQVLRFLALVAQPVQRRHSIGPIPMLHGET